MNVVLDTNVIVSGLIRPANPPGLILDHWQNRTFALIFSRETIGELDRVMARPEVAKYFRRSPEWRASFVQDLRQFAAVVEPVPVNAVPEDPPDNLVVGTALAGDCDYLVSGNRHLLDLGSFQGIPIVTPHQFLVILAQGS